jgi:topoisomerase-4 subunit A
MASDPHDHRYGRRCRYRLDVRSEGRAQVPVASSDGQGFVVNEDDCVANTRKGKQVLNVSAPNQAAVIATVTGDTVAVIGTNHKMVIFPLSVPEMARGRGVRLQKYSGGKLSDVMTFTSKDGMTWGLGRPRTSFGLERARRLACNRADAGRLAHGFPKSNKFGKVIE